jgi:2-hydroxycyclohexanecarboxyl-CoA dehydrogenase
MRGLKDKVVVVTGGAGGIGAATCKRFGEEGAAKVAVWISISESAQTVANEHRRCGWQSAGVCGAT